MKKQKKRGFFRVLLRVLAVVLCLLIAAAAVLFVIPLTEQTANKTTPRSADWMKDLDGSLRLNEIVLPGAHDCGTQYVQLAFAAKCQALDVREQLEAGVRYLDVRLGFAPAEGEKTRRMQLMHGFTKCRTGAMPWEETLYLDRVLDQCAEFLNAHPTETVLFVVKQEHGSETAADFETWLNGELTNRGGLCLLTDAVPTLDEARGKLVLARRYEDAAGLGAGAGIPVRWTEQGGHGDGTAHIELTEQGDGPRLWVQDRYCYGTEEKWTAFLAGLACGDVGPDDIAIHFLSTKGTLPFGHPYGYAKTLNKRLLELPAAELRGWIVLDFADAALCEHVWSANFAEQP